jgi:hypothetical protein
MTDIDQTTQEVVVAPSWEQVRLEYLHVNLKAGAKDGTPPVSLKVLAQRYGLIYGTLRNKAAEEDWTGQLALMRAAAKEVTTASVVHLTLQTEIEIRTRQVHYGRVAQDIAMERLLQLDPSTLTPKETIELLKLGTDLERKAAGMEDEYTAPPQTSLKDTQTREAVRQTLLALETFRNRLKLKQNAPNPA